jgi:glutathione synthase
MKILGILDPLQGPDGPYELRKDTSHLLLLEFSRRGHEIFLTDPSRLRTNRGQVFVSARRVQVLRGNPYFEATKPRLLPAASFQLILMRKDPPVDAAYLKATRILSLVPKPTWVCNSPEALARWNEKKVILEFPDWIPPTRVTADVRAIRRFALRAGGCIVLKSLLSFGGRGVSRVEVGNPDFGKVVRTATGGGRRPVMAQAFLPAIYQGEKRIFLIDGQPLGAIRRIPPAGGFLANPDLGARIMKTRLTGREKRLCGALAPFLRKNGIFFAGVDAIGEKLTEINITSPGMLWEWNEVDGKRHERRIVDLFEKRMIER